ncbi:hypothetical protein CPB84DRAFT_1841622 [Gymnopilus junonius]|uniref:Uncharacterized protein n=1 Tax=Gymnopilus junonius TaxID=109634 RepID=A0A9P5P0X9_GYMJU|nr:hypothetical protein CPB84DRAFT_1841622 [Gymnopilus junonius]
MNSSVAPAPITLATITVTLRIAFITEYLVQCPIAKPPIPYFPIPDNAPDSCSCNLGKVNLAITSSAEQGATCSNNANGPDAASNVQEIEGCDCCELSSALSTMYAICPDTNPNLIGLPAIQQLATILETPFDSCSASLSEFNCVSHLDFPDVPGGIFYNPSNLPLTGTATLSNLPGTVTAPASGAVFT